MKDEVIPTGPVSNRPERLEPPAGVPKSGSTKGLVVGAVVVALVVVGLLGAVRVVRQRASELAYANLATCVLGQPLSAFEPPSVRFHAIQLAAMGGAPEALPQAGRPGWPMRCAPLAQAVARDRKLARGQKDAIALSSARLAEQLATYSVLTQEVDLSESIDRVFKDGAAANIRWSTATETLLPPPPVKAPSVDTLELARALFRKPFSTLTISPSPFTDTSVRFVVDDAALGRPALCAWSGPGAPVRCREVPPSIAQGSGLGLFGTTADGVEPFLFAGPHARDGIVDSTSGARVSDKLPYGIYGATSRAAGTLDYLTWADSVPGVHLRHVAADGTATDARILQGEDLGNPYYSTTLAWDWLVYRAVKDDQIHVFFRKLLDGRALGPVEDAGLVGSGGAIEGGDREELHTTACRSREGIAVRFKGWNRQYVAIRVNGRWASPVEAAGTGGVLTCHGTEAVLTSFDARNVRQSRCGAAGCAEQNVDLSALSGGTAWATDARVAAMDVAGNLLLVWYAGAAGGVRMRFGPIDKFAATSDVVLFDDHVQEGKFVAESRFSGFRVLPVDGGALLLIGTTVGVFAYSIDRSGKTVPVDVSVAAPKP